MSSSGRRWEPESGEQKLREKIHKESKFADDHKKLPFSFSKPPIGKKHDWFRCLNCDYIVSAPKNTIMIICSKCHTVSKVERG